MKILLLTFFGTILIFQITSAQIVLTSGSVTCIDDGVCLNNTCGNAPSVSDGDPLTAGSVTTALGALCTNTLTANFSSLQAAGLWAGFYVSGLNLATIVATVSITIRNTSTSQTQTASGLSLLSVLGNGNAYLQLHSTIAFNQISITLGGVLLAAQTIQIYTGFSSTVLQGSPLAVTWLSFSAKEKNSTVLLEWSTATEDNSDYFSIERSVDGINYSEIGRIKAAGNSSSVTNYVFTDPIPVSRSQNYYRLRQVDFDGRYQYSVTRYAMVGGTGRSIRIAPNPATSYVLINGDLNRMRVRIFDIYGKQILEKNLSGTQMKLDISSLSIGSYFLAIDDYERIRDREKLIVTR